MRAYQAFCILLPMVLLTSCASTRDGAGDVFAEALQPNRRIIIVAEYNGQTLVNQDISLEVIEVKGGWIKVICHNKTEQSSPYWINTFGTRFSWRLME